MYIHKEKSNNNKIYIFKIKLKLNSKHIVIQKYKLTFIYNMVLYQTTSKYVSTYTNYQTTKYHIYKS